MEVVVSLSQGRTAAAQCGLFTHKSVPVILNHLILNVLSQWGVQSRSGTVFRISCTFI